MIDDSFMQTKDMTKDPIDTSEDKEDPDPSVSYTTSVPTLLYQYNIHIISLQALHQLCTIFCHIAQLVQHPS